MYINRQINLRPDRWLHYVNLRSPKTVLCSVVTFVCVLFVLYKALVYESTYQLELRAAEVEDGKVSVFNINHNPPEKQFDYLKKRPSSSQQTSLRASKQLSEDPLNVFSPNDLFNDWLPPFGVQSVPEVETTFFSSIDTLYVIPGGGSGISLDKKAGNKTLTDQIDDYDAKGYPEWTRRRSSAAFRHFSSRSVDEQNKSIFLALSAGSLNSPNAQLKDSRILFECQHVLKHLSNLGVPSNRLFGDWESWDTVTNAIVLRRFIDGLVIFRGPQAPPLRVLVFISDFHHQRMRQAISWVLSLRPQPLIGPYSFSDNGIQSEDSTSKHALRGKYVEVEMQVVDSLGLTLFQNPTAWKSRLQHEESGVAQLLRHQKRITTLRQLQAFAYLGGHAGLRKYMMQQYQPSGSTGW